MILVINPGSSSIKFKLFNSDLSKSLSKDIDFAGKNVKAPILKFLKEIEDINKISKIGIRVVHGGGKYDKPTLITNEVLGDIKKFSVFAPLHNPLSYNIIRLLKKYLAKIDIYAVFDTAFFANLPEESKLYAIPSKISERNQIKRYGFHGISHKYVLEKVDPKEKLKVITVHLGSGCSMTAINCGKVIQTSMGLTPISGLIMQNRSGDLDPGLVLYLVKLFGYKKSKEIIENSSGLYGIYEKTGSMRQILIDAGEKVLGEDNIKKQADKQAILALKIYINRIREYIGAYSALMGGVDVIAITGISGFRSGVIREMSTKGLEFLGFKKVLAIEPNEELAIADEIN
jgi:acetate kinase